MKDTKKTYQFYTSWYVHIHTWYRFRWPWLISNRLPLPSKRTLFLLFRRTTSFCLVRLSISTFIQQRRIRVIGVFLTLTDTNTSELRHELSNLVTQTFWYHRGSKSTLLYWRSRNGQKEKGPRVSRGIFLFLSLRFFTIFCGVRNFTKFLILQIWQCIVLVHIQL